MDIKTFFTNYWIEWLFGAIAAGVTFFARHYVKLQKQVLQDALAEKEESIKKATIESLRERMDTFETSSVKEDERLNQEIKLLTERLDDLQAGILSIQSKQFIDFCEQLLQQDHQISLSEYEQFESDYMAYKALKGNHRGDALHQRVVDKFTAQIQLKADDDND